MSELVKEAPEARVVRFVDRIDADAASLSVLTIGEIRRGVDRLPESRRRERIQAWLTHDLPRRFEGAIVAIHEPVAHTWGSLTARLEEAGRPMPVIDSLIAATALHHGLTLVTRNEADFAESGVDIANPWNDGPPSQT